ncbi:MAG: XshC-Cox1-family protein, partial [Pelosinus sp.]|nr:XshC-Cox1-family protein [Pelosinus sp.]
LPAYRLAVKGGNKMDAKIFKAICIVKEEKSRAVLVTVIDTRGSTPRKAGTKMLVYPDGKILGTIGGGCTESEAKLQALRALDEGVSFTHILSLLDDTAADEGMVCGGTMEIFLQVICSS